MMWLKEKVLWVIGGIVALFTVYIMGRKGKENETNKDLLKVAKKSKRVNDIPFNELVKRMQDYNDK